MLDPLDLDLGDSAALQARQEDAPEAIADGVAEPAFEGLDVELAVDIGQLFAGADDPAGKFEATPTDAHLREFSRGSDQQSAFSGQPESGGGSFFHRPRRPHDRFAWLNADR